MAQQADSMENPRCVIECSPPHARARNRRLRRDRGCTTCRDTTSAARFEPGRLPACRAPPGRSRARPACSKSHAGVAPAAAATVADSATAAPHPPPTWKCPRVLLRGHTADTLPRVPGRSLNGADSVVDSPEGRPARRPNREPPSHVTRHQQRRGFILPSPPHTSQPHGSHIRDQRELANRLSTPAALRPRQLGPCFRTSMFRHVLSPATATHRPFYAALRHFGVVVEGP